MSQGVFGASACGYCAWADWSGSCYLVLDGSFSCPDECETMSVNDVCSQQSSFYFCINSVPTCECNSLDCSGEQDSSRTKCECCGNTYGEDNWDSGTQKWCCGDDSGETRRGSGSSSVCCSSSNDCAFDGTCYATGVLRDGLLCSGGTWYGCDASNAGVESAGMCCTGSSWTNDPKPESSYSCSDGLDNDCDLGIDCFNPGADPDCPCCNEVGEDCGSQGCCFPAQCNAGSETCCLPDEESCGSDADCCGNSCLDGICQDCTDTAGASCSDNNDCCGDLLCVDGACELSACTDNPCSPDGFYGSDQYCCYEGTEGDPPIACYKIRDFQAGG